MGIFDELFGRHGHRKEKEIQELLEIIKKQEQNETKLLRQNEHLEWERDKLEHQLIKCLKEKEAEHVKLVIISSKNKNQTNMAIQLDQGQFSLDSLGLIDADLGTPVSATFANVSFVSSDPSVFTTAPDPNNPSGTIDTAVAAGTANLTGTADASYTDSKTGKTVTQTGLTVTVPVIVNAVVAGENVALTIIQGTPQILAASKKA